MRNFHLPPKEACVVAVTSTRVAQIFFASLLFVSIITSTVEPQPSTSQSITKSVLSTRDAHTANAASTAVGFLVDLRLTVLLLLVELVEIESLLENMLVINTVPNNSTSIKVPQPYCFRSSFTFFAGLRSFFPFFAGLSAALAIGAPQPGQLGAFFEISLLQSGQFMRLEKSASGGFCSLAALAALAASAALVSGVSGVSGVSIYSLSARPLSTWRSDAPHRLQTFNLLIFFWPHSGHVSIFFTNCYMPDL